MQFSIAQVFKRSPDREIFLYIGLFQGLAIYGLVDKNDWLSEHLIVAYPLWLVVLVWPVLLMLSVKQHDYLRAFKWVTGFTILLALLAAYTGWQASPHEEFDVIFSPFEYVLPTLVAIFVALIHLQPAIWRTEPDYETFFTLSWRNFLTVGLSLALVLGVTLILYLWELLFETIGVYFFSILFDKGWFLFPVLAMSFAFGLQNFRAATTVIDSMSSLLMRLMWLLLPLLALLCASFLVTLLFTGLQPLWDTDWGTEILILANLLSLFFLNAVYQTGSSRPYPLLVHRALTFVIALLPIFSALSLYGLALRIAQYGWTISRCWAFLIIALMALFSLGYAYLIVRRRSDWPSGLPWINKHVSWVVLASLLLTTSPLLDFRVISAWSLFSAVASGETHIDDLDVEYVQTWLARPGYLRLQSLLSSLENSDPEAAQNLRARIENKAGMTEVEVPRNWTVEQKAQIVMRPESIDIPRELEEVINRNHDGPPDFIFRVDLGGEGEAYEIVSMEIFDIDGEAVSARARCWQKLAVPRAGTSSWFECGYSTVTWGPRDEFFQELRQGDFRAVTPKRPDKNLQVGRHVFEFLR